MRDEFARQEQARIKAQIREGEKLAREIDKQIKDAERERAAIQAALEKALKETQDEHSARGRTPQRSIERGGRKGTTRDFASPVDEGGPRLRAFQHRLVR